MRLGRINLTNFKGLRSFNTDLCGNNATIRGENGAGKTTIFDAVWWVLFDKDSLGRKQFGIRPSWIMSEKGAPNTTVEIELYDIPHKDKPVVLKRTLYEQWTTPRGSLEPVFKGYKTTYYVNDYEAKANEYTAFISGLIAEETFKLLTNPLYFTEDKNLDWKRRRELIFPLLGDREDQAGIWQKDLDEANKSRKSLVDELQEITSYIKEATYLLPDPPILPEHLNTNYDSSVDYEEKLLELRKKRIEATVTSQKIQLEHELIRAETERFKLVEQIKADINLAIRDLEYGARSIDKEIFDTNDLIEKYEGLNNDLRDRYTDIEAREIHVSQKCPTCGKLIPEELQSKIKHQLHVDRENELESINKAGVNNNTQISALNIRLEELQKEQAQYQESLKNAQIALNDASNSQEVESITETINRLNKAIVDCLEGTPADVSSLDLEIAQTEELNNYTLALEAYEVNNSKITKRLEILEEKKSEIKKQHDESDRVINDIQELIREKASAVEAKVSEKFELVSFRLFRTNINGNIEDCCEVVSKDGIAYSDLSYSQKKKAGLDIIRTFSRHYNLSCPVFVDNRESITELPKMDCQIISLIVNPIKSGLLVSQEKASSRKESKQKIKQEAML